MTQNNCRIIGLTGGIATGKSTVSSILKDKGYKTIDADKISKEILEIGKPAYKDLVDYFSTSILDKDKSIDRKKLGEIVFSDNNLLKKLNNITHPYIFKTIKKNIEKYSGNNILFLDIPLLFEEFDKFKEYNILFDEIWLVYTDEDTQINRLMKRNNYTREEAKKRIKTQIPIEEKLSKSDKIIDNRKDMLILEKNIEALLKTL